MLNELTIHIYKLRVRSGRSKMVTGTQLQTMWALWTRDFADPLETCLAEVKHKGEPKVLQSKPLDHGRLLHTTIYWKNSWIAKSLPHRPAAPLCQALRPRSVPDPGPTRNLLLQAVPAPALHWIHGQLGSTSLGYPTPQALLAPSSMWDDWIHAPLGSLPLGSCRAPAQTGFHSGCYRRAPNLPKRHRQTGLDAKGVTWE
jgi:hypothetical protein